MNDYKIFGIDFDGTLCENKWPEIGEPIQPMIDYCIKLREQGHKLILWTCRTGEQIEQAVKWCNERGLFFHAVNANLPDEIVKYNNDPRKIGADYFIDDKSLNIEEIIRQITPLTATKINILGTEYTIFIESRNDNSRLDDTNGYCDYSTKEIHICNFEEDSKAKHAQAKMSIYRNKVLRHEVLHGFLLESGLDTHSGETESWAINESMVDWFAIQSPKIFKVYEELGIL